MANPVSDRSPRQRPSASRIRDDEGTIGLLTLGMAVLALAVILVVTAASVVHSEHMRLMTVADELALEAADAADLDAYYRGEAAENLSDASAGVALSQEAMEEQVAERVAAAGDRLAGVRVLSVTTPDGETAVVTVGLTVRPLLGAEGLLPFLGGINLIAVGTARAS
jgi:cell division protein FtsL